MSDTFVTFHGWVGGEVVHRTARDLSVVNFRVGSTPRIKKKSGWTDGETTWYSVNAWRGLADNIHHSVKKGDAVIVHGRLRTDTWERQDGQVSQTLVVEASFVGHDLSRGTSVFLKSSRPERTEVDDDHEIQEMIHQQPDGLTPMDSWGNPIPSESESEPGSEPGSEPVAQDPAA